MTHLGAFNSTWLSRPPDNYFGLGSTNQAALEGSKPNSTFAGGDHTGGESLAYAMADRSTLAMSRP